MSPSKPLGSLIAPPSTPGVEVSLFDGRLRRLAPEQNKGQLLWNVPRGIYKVRYEAGSSMHEQFVTVEDVTTPTFVPSAPLLFTSAAPLDNTSSTHEYHQDPAAQVSRRPPRVLGHGADLFAMIRSRDKAFRRNDPAGGLTLVRDDRTVLAFGESPVEGGGTCIALRVSLDPGAYVLRCESSDGVALEQTLFIAADWQTQLFISEAPAEDSWDLDMAGLSVLMSAPNDGFDPSNRDLQVAELARKALRRGQQSLSEAQVRVLLNGKFQNPMLGILAAHVLLLADRPDVNLLREVLANVAGLIPGHPDVFCLQAALDLPHQAPLTVPPMVSRSWELLVRSSQLVDSLLNDASRLADMALSRWQTGGTWLTWGGAPRESFLSNATYYLTAPEGYWSTVRSRLPVPQAAVELAHSLLLSVADDQPPEPNQEIPRPIDEAIQDRFAHYLTTTVGLSESETAFVVNLVLSYARSGPPDIRADVLARSTQMPAPIVRVVARRLAERLGPPREPSTNRKPRREDDQGYAGSS